MRKIIFVFILLAAVSACSSEKTRDKYPVSNAPGGPVDPALVKKLYDVKCAICHGYDGQQQFAGAKNLGESTLNRDAVITQITHGKGTMPPQKDILTEEQIEALADFVISLRTR